MPTLPTLRITRKLTCCCVIVWWCHAWHCGQNLLWRAHRLTSNSEGKIICSMTECMALYQRTQTDKARDLPREYFRMNANSSSGSFVNDASLHGWLNLIILPLFLKFRFKSFFNSMIQQYFWTVTVFNIMKCNTLRCVIEFRINLGKETHHGRCFVFDLWWQVSALLVHVSTDFSVHIL